MNVEEAALNQNHEQQAEENLQEGQAPQQNNQQRPDENQKNGGQQGEQAIQIRQPPAIKKVKLITCTSGNKATYACSDESCTLYAFLCENKRNCKCYQQHQYCTFSDLTSIKVSLNRRKSSFFPIREALDKFIDDTIDQLSTYRENLLVEMQKNYESICLSLPQNQFLERLQTGQVDGLCGKNICQIISKAQFIQKVKTIISKTKRDMEKTWNVMNQELKKFEVDFKEKLNRCTLVQDRFFFKSQIVTTFEEVKNIQGFLQTPIKNATLMYRASQNAFQVDKFFDKCDHTKNTVTLIKTQHGKIIGGFNPYVWIKPNNEEYYKDASGKSFIFSLSNNQKLTLTTQDHAIHRLPGYGPAWGSGTDLAIFNKANENDTSHAEICKTYASEKYKEQNRTLYERFTGAPTGNCKFRIKQWEVWKLQFNEQ